MSKGSFLVYIDNKLTQNSKKFHPGKLHLSMTENEDLGQYFSVEEEYLNVSRRKKGFFRQNHN